MSSWISPLQCIDSILLSSTLCTYIIYSMTPYLQYGLHHIQYAATSYTVCSYIMYSMWLHHVIIHSMRLHHLQYDIICSMRLHHTHYAATAFTVCDYTIYSMRLHHIQYVATPFTARYHTYSTWLNHLQYDNISTVCCYIIAVCSYTIYSMILSTVCG